MGRVGDAGVDNAADARGLCGINSALVLFNARPVETSRNGNVPPAAA